MHLFISGCSYYIYTTDAIHRVFKNPSRPSFSAADEKRPSCIYSYSDINQCIFNSTENAAEYAIIAPAKVQVVTSDRCLKVNYLNFMCHHVPNLWLSIIPICYYYMHRYIIYYGLWPGDPTQRSTHHTIIYNWLVLCHWYGRR